MNRLTQQNDEKADSVDLGTVALAGMMIGALLSLAGLLQPHPVLSSIADVYDARPSLTAGQTLFLGLALLAGGSGLYAWNANRNKTRLVHPPKFAATASDP